MNLCHVAVFLLACLVNVDGGCDVGKSRYGCKIYQGECICSLGCITDIQYPNRNECQKTLKGERTDTCQGNPCANNGACTQTSRTPWYRCRCEGTGYYGSRCQYPCPKPGYNSLKVYPYECIVI